MNAIKLPVIYKSLSPEKRREVRLQYIELQEGKCAHCGQPLKGRPSLDVEYSRINWECFPPNFRKFPIHLHHSHETGLTIGAVHMKCNAWLWQYRGE